MFFLLIPIILYAFLILWISHYWFWGKTNLSSSGVLDTKVTVLIPFKNEADSLPQLLEQFKQQSYPQGLVDFIFINDHSSDGGESLIEDSGFALVNNSGNGKKTALLEGLVHAKGQLIVTLDADCLPQPEWLETIVRTYESTLSDLIICPVSISPGNTLWGKMQAIEFQSLAASTAGAALGSHPIMCNGANLAFSKSLVDTNEDVFNAKYTSGDDMFLLEYAKRKKGRITYLKNHQAMVTTASETWRDFWKQRLRWTSKSSGYNDATILFTGVLVFLSNFSLLILPFFSLQLTLVAFVMKAMVDALLLVSSAAFFGTTRHLWVFPLILPFYPFYVVCSAIGGLFPRRW